MTSLRMFVLAMASVVTSSFVEVRSAEAPSPLVPSERHEALAFYEGVWTSAHDDRVGVRETCGWLPGGRRHIVCTARKATKQGLREALGIYSYDEQRAEYVYHGFAADGSVAFEHGQRIADGFQFFSEEGVGADRSQTRFTIVESANGKISTVLERSKAGDSWGVVERVDYVRTRPSRAARSVVRSGTASR